MYTRFFRSSCFIYCMYLYGMLNNAILYLVVVVEVVVVEFSKYFCTDLITSHFMNAVHINFHMVVNWTECDDFVHITIQYVCGTWGNNYYGCNLFRYLQHLLTYTRRRTLFILILNQQMFSYSNILKLVTSASQRRHLWFVNLVIVKVEVY